MAHAGLPGRVGVVPASALGVPDAVVPTAGSWATDGAGLRFTPRFSLPRGAEYVLVRRVPGAAVARWVEVARLGRPAVRTVPTASVVAIHPSGPEVPENLLRLSVTFSAPMDEGSAAGHVHLEDAEGREIPYALLPMPPELWDRAHRRLTLLLEPGRIKRGLVPNTVLGAPLAGYGETTLVVEAGLRDGAGTPLVAGARRRYRVGPAVRARVDPGRWRLTWPAAGSRDGLVVDLDRPLDHALALRCLRVTAADGTPVDGRAGLGLGELRWTFSPTTPWPVGGCALHVDTRLEDLAGNSVRRVFDRDLRVAEDDPLDAAEVVLTPGA